MRTTKIMMRPPLKKKLFLVQRPGVYITAEWDFFFFYFAAQKIFGQNFIIFLQKKNKKREKKDFPAARLATISATGWTGNIFFFKGGLFKVTDL